MDFFIPDNIKIILSFILAMLFVGYATPSVIRISKTKKLVAKPNGRTSHHGNIPHLGGFAIFTGAIITLLFFWKNCDHAFCNIFLISSVIIFIIGLKDDLVQVDPRKKLIGQVTAYALLVILTDLRFTSLHGFLGIHEIPYVVSILLTLFVVIVITNSFNLIDGIDGLAAGTGAVAMMAFGIWFWINGYTALAILCSTMLGAFGIFLYFNVWGRKNKVFMGDSGSLFLGFTIAFLAIKFNQLNLYQTNEYAISSAPAVSIGILIVPLFDTLRVFIIRIRKGQSPFKADKSHVHHNLLAIFHSHKKVTLTIVVANVFFIAVAIGFQFLGILELVAIELTLGIILSYLPIYILKRSKKFTSWYSTEIPTNKKLTNISFPTFHKEKAYSKN